jgi:hypothetical protein
MINGLKAYCTTLFSGLMAGVIAVHTIEDIVLLSIGRFLPVPVWAMYAVGLLTSWFILSGLMHSTMKRSRKHDHSSMHQHDVNDYDNYR